MTPNLELLINFGMTLEGVCHELDTEFHYKRISYFEQASCDQNKNSLKKTPSEFGMIML
jgi:hypothetical protein